MKRQSALKTAAEDPMFLKVFSRALAFVPSNPRFACRNCLDRGFAFTKAVVGKYTYRIPYHCAERYTTGRSGKCGAANKVVQNLLVETVKAEPHAKHGKKGEKAWDDDGAVVQDESIRVTLTKLLPSKMESERMARAYVSELEAESEVVIFRKPMAESKASKVLADIEPTIASEDELGGIVALAQALQEQDADE